MNNLKPTFLTKKFDYMSSRYDLILVFLISFKTMCHKPYNVYVKASNPKPHSFHPFEVCCLNKGKHLLIFFNVMMRFYKPTKLYDSDGPMFFLIE